MRSHVGGGRALTHTAPDESARPHCRARATSLLAWGGRERRAFDSSLREAGGGRQGRGEGRARGGGAGKALLTGECHTIAIMLPGYPPRGILALTGAVMHSRSAPRRRLPSIPQGSFAPRSAPATRPSAFRGYAAFKQHRPPALIRLAAATTNPTTRLRKLQRPHRIVFRKDQNGC